MSVLLASPPRLEGREVTDANGIAAESRRSGLPAERMFKRRAFYRLIDRLYRAPSLPEVYEATLDTIIELLGCGKASILRFDKNGVMRFVGWRELSDGYRQAVEGHSPWRMGDPDPDPIFIADIAKATEARSLMPVLRQEGIQALAFIPVTHNRATVGKLVIYHAAPHDFDEEEREVALILARQLSFSIERHAADMAAGRLMALIEFLGRCDHRQEPGRCHSKLELRRRAALRL